VGPGSVEKARYLLGLLARRLQPTTPRRRAPIDGIRADFDHPRGELTPGSIDRERILVPESPRGPCHFRKGTGGLPAEYGIRRSIESFDDPSATGMDDQRVPSHHHIAIMVDASLGRHPVELNAQRPRGTNLRTEA
jgi:hypothetical protein